VLWLIFGASHAPALMTDLMIGSISASLRHSRKLPLDDEIECYRFLEVTSI